MVCLQNYIDLHIFKTILLLLVLVILSDNNQFTRLISNTYLIVTVKCHKVDGIHMDIKICLQNVIGVI